jgi:bifunctional non-homologous end joining protein LigD
VGKHPAGGGHHAAFSQEARAAGVFEDQRRKGLHVVVPIKRIYDWETAKGFSRAVVTHLAKTLPDRLVAKSGGKNRVGKIFIDYLRNGLGATTACAWSVPSENRSCRCFNA